MQKTMNTRFKVASGIIEGFFSPLANTVFHEKENENGTRTQLRINCVGHFLWNRSFGSSYGHFFIFPVFFDFLDIYCENRFYLHHVNFSQREKVIKKNRNKGMVDDGFLYEVYRLATEWRCAIVHHDYKLENNCISIGNVKVKLRHFKALNEIIFQYILRRMDGNHYSLNSMYTSFIQILDDCYPKRALYLKDLICSGEGYIETRLHINRYFYQRNYNISITDPIIFKLGAYFIKNEDEYINKECDLILDSQSGKKILCPLVLRSSDYAIKNNDDVYLFPGELIENNPEISLKDMEIWKVKV